MLAALRCFWLVFLLFVALPYGVVAQPQKLSAKKIFIFPSNLTFVYKEGSLQFNNQRVLLEDVPNALYGTYWLYPAGDFTITKTVFANDSVSIREEARTFFDILKANVGAQAAVTYKIGEEIDDAVGEILPFTAGEDLAMIKMPTGNTILIHKDQVKQVAIKGQIKTAYWQKKIGKATTIEIDKNLKTAGLQMFYFQTGFSFTPSYSLKLLNDTAATLSMKCMLDNQAENFENTEVKLVIGAPNLRYGYALDPIAVELITKLPIGKTDRQVAPNAIVQGYKDSGKLEAESLVMDTTSFGANPITEKTPRGQFYFYDVGSLSMKKNTKAYVPIFNRKVNYQAVYQCFVPNRADTLYPPQLEETAWSNDVFQAIQFKNNGDAPFVSGSIFLLDSLDRPLAQDQMPFTAPEEMAAIKIGRPANIACKTDEKLVAIEKNIKVEKGVFEKVKLKGNIRITNNSPQDITLTLTKELCGEITKNSLAETAPLNRKVGTNPVWSLKWKLKVKAGGSQVTPYEYVYLRPSK